MTTDTHTAAGHAVTVYGQPGCQPCKATTRTMDKAGVPYTYVDVAADDQGREQAASHGWNSTPVVELRDVEGEVVAAWHGLRVESVHALTSETLDPATLDLRETGGQDGQAGGTVTETGGL